MRFAWVDISSSPHLLQMDPSVAVDWTLCATARKACIANLVLISRWWIVHAKHTRRLLEQSKSLSTVIAACIRNFMSFYRNYVYPQLVDRLGDPSPIRKA